MADNDLKIFIQKPEEAEQQSKRLAEIYEAMFKGFFHCAAKGLAFVPETKVANRFGHSPKENYPEANESFLKFAKTYWTLRVLEFDLMDYDWEWIGARLLAKLEQDIGPVFFPFPGLQKITPTQREESQRELISKSGADINIDEFMTGNPILIRDRWLENLLPKIKEMELKQIERNRETEAALERMKIKETGSDMVGQDDESLYTGEVELEDASTLSTAEAAPAEQDKPAEVEVAKSSETFIEAEDLESVNRRFKNLLPKVKEMELRLIERNRETEATLERMKIEATGSDMVGQDDESLYTGEVEVVLGLSADADILAKLSVCLVHTPEIKINPTVGSSDRGSIITMVLDKPLPLVEMLSLQIPEAQVTGEPWGANDKKRKARRIIIARKEADIIPTEDSQE